MNKLWVLACASLAANVWLVQRVLRPVRRLAADAQRLSEGDLTAFGAACGGIAEVDAVRRSMLAMSGHVRRAQQQSRVYTDAMADGQEAERARIARELHDDTVQSLIAISQRIEFALASDPAAARPLLEGARTQAVEAVANLRSLIADLRPPALDELGLVAALRMLASKPGDVEVTVDVQGTQRRIDPGVELALYRAAHEALTNARKHARARHVALTVRFGVATTEVMVKDDGAGFDWPLPADALLADGHFGIVGMAERIQRFGGTLAVDSAPGKGTQVRISMPLHQVDQPSNRVRDPVCSVEIAPDEAYGSVEYEGKRYYFCCPVCQGTFQRDPAAYATADEPNGP